MTNHTQLVRSNLDSARFEINVERGLFGADTPIESILGAVEESDADLIIIRVPAGRTDVATELQRRGEFVMHADTLVYYGLDLTPDAGEASSLIRRATTDDRLSIIRIAEAGFRTYRAHYAANPLLPTQRVHEGYVEWAQSRLENQDDSASTWVAMDGNVVAGFATCDCTDGVADIVLNAVHPDHERRGHYGRLLRYIIRHHAQRGDARLTISTQVWNYTVQRQWTRAGLLLDTAFDTYHLDRRLRRV